VDNRCLQSLEYLAMPIKPEKKKSGALEMDLEIK
jgi:hypothetical protein